MQTATAKKTVDNFEGEYRTVKVHSKGEAIDILHSLYLFSTVSIGEMLAGIKLEGLNMEETVEVYNYLMNKF